MIDFIIINFIIQNKMLIYKINNYHISSTIQQIIPYKKDSI